MFPRRRRRVTPIFSPSSSSLKQPVVAAFIFGFGAWKKEREGEEKEDVDDSSPPPSSPQKREESQRFLSLFFFSLFLPLPLPALGRGGSFSRKGTRGVFGPWKIASKHAAALLSGSGEETLLISGFDLTTRRLLLHLPCLMYILFLPIPSILKSGEAWIRFLPPSSKKKRREGEGEDILLSLLPAMFEFDLRGFPPGVSSFLCS